MASLADEFLQDIEDEDDAQQQQSDTYTYAITPIQQPSSSSAAASSTSKQPKSGDAMSDDDDQDDDSDDDNMDDANAPVIDVTGKGVIEIAKIGNSDQLKAHLAKIELFSKRQQLPTGGAALLDDPEYPYILASNKLVLELEEEITLLHKYARDRYVKKFPDLENHVQNPYDYARLVKRIGSLVDISSMDLSDILPPSIVMVVKVMASTSSSHQTLTDVEYAQVMKAVDEILRLEEVKRKILDYVSSRMMSVAPNLSVIVGTKIAAQLIGIAGGLTALSKIPAANVQCLGKSKKILAGFSAKTMIRHIGYIGNCELVMGAPSALRKKTGRFVSMKATLAARIDAQHQSSDGSMGIKLKEQCEEIIRKWQEPPPAKQEKPLPVPDEKKKKKRGGKNARRNKEIFGMTEVRKKQNRMMFGVAEEEDLETGKGFGLLGSESGNTRLAVKTKAKNSKLKKKLENQNKQYGGSTAVSGFATSLAFTAASGFELVAPQQQQQHAQSIHGHKTSSGAAGSSTTVPNNNDNKRKSAVAQLDDNGADKYFASTSFAKVKKQRVEQQDQKKQ